MDRLQEAFVPLRKEDNKVFTRRTFDPPTGFNRDTSELIYQTLRLYNNHEESIEFMEDEKINY